MSRGGARADLSQWPLIGRDDELALAREAVASGNGVVLTGPAGVGKTRLAREVLDLAAAAGGRVEWIAATESAAGVPLGAVAHLVPSSALGGDRDLTLRGIVAALERESERGRLLLGVDDAHLLDDGSAALVHMLAATGTASVVVTVRSGEHVPDSIVALWKDGPATVIALQALARSEVEKIVRSALSGPIEGSSLHFLWESSGGNTLYLRELLRHGIESGALRRDRDLWRWHGPFRPSERLQDLVAMRIGSLDDEEWATLEVVAIGDPVPVSCLHELRQDGTAERLERRGILASRRRTRTEINLAHPLIGEVVRARMPQSRLDQVRLDLARTLEATGDGSVNDEFRVVLWRADAGDHSEPERLRAAARRAWTLWSPEVAERLARAALASGPDLEAGHLLGEALSDLGRISEAIEVWEQVQDLEGPDRIRASLAMGYASAYRYHLNRPAEAHAILNRAASRVTDHEALQVIEGAMAMFGATELAAQVAPAPPEDNVAPSAALAAGVRQATSGQLEAGTLTIDAALATADRWVQEFPTVILLLRMTRQWARLFAGHIAEVEAETLRQYAIALAERIEYPRVSWCLMRGVVGVLRGLPSTAAAVLGEGVEVIGTDDRGWLRPMHAYRSMALALQGDVVAAEHHEQLADQCNRAIDGIFAVEVQRARGWVRAARGELSSAVDEARAAADLAAELGQSTYEVLALHDIARFGRAKDVVDRLVVTSARVDGMLAVSLAAHARALADEDGRTLDEASAQFESLGLDLFAAEAAAAAARAHRDAGRKASSYSSRDRARRLIVERCEAAVVPGLSGIDGSSADLTTREREVCELAASGLPSRSIAQRLGITTRTVDNLLGRVYTKLGVSGRRELVATLGDRTPRE